MKILALICLIGISIKILEGISTKKEIQWTLGWANAFGWCLLYLITK